MGVGFYIYCLENSIADTAISFIRCLFVIYFFYKLLLLLLLLLLFPAFYLFSHFPGLVYLSGGEGIAALDCQG